MQPSAIRDRFDADSNRTEKSDLRPEKHSSSKTLTDAGRMMSTKPLPLNASFSNRDNLDPDLDLTEKSDPHK
jgi:hypothetical protein